MASVFIDGEAGTTGLLIRERLALLPVEVLSVAESRRKDSSARQALMADVDLVVLCLPDAAAVEAVALAGALGDRAPRILDASSAHRVAPGWVYGFSEMVSGQAEQIAGAARVSNPGCYATGAVALLRPLVEAGLLPPDTPISINAVSGFSGGGKSMIEAHARDGGPAFSLYGLDLAHKHVPEIFAHGGLSRRPIFIPSVGHFRQGMLVSIPLHLDALPGRPGAEDLRRALASHYAGSEQVAVRDDFAGTTLLPEALNGTDLLELFVFGGGTPGQAVLVARLDNLGKGAAGAAVQNIRLMLRLGQEVPSHAQFRVPSAPAA